VNYHKKVWHHYLMPLDDNSGFMVVDRNGNDDNCVETQINKQIHIHLS
jgi:ureidoglycolate lyase